MNKNILVIGAGEIGTSIIDLYTHLQSYTVYYLDINKKTDKAIDIKTLQSYIDIEVLHVCIPFTESFTEVITSYLFMYKPLQTYIHSTVKTGTTRKVYTNTINGTNGIIAYTPVMGIHPNLTESIKTFKKIVGCINEEDKEIVLKHFNELKIIPVFYNKVEEAEAAKLFSTSYYGAIIRFMQDTYKYCEENDLDFDNVYTETNKIYNEGYTKMNMSHVIRPILKYMGTGIGKHCVTSNAMILYQHTEGLNIPKLIASGGYNIPKNLQYLPKYQVKDWLFCEYIGKERSTSDIGEECGVTDVTIRNYLKKFSIPIRLKYWTIEEDKKLTELSQEMNFKEIVESGLINKTYEQIRKRVYGHLNLKSVYDPSIMDEKTRKKISCTLRDLSYDDFDDFLWKQQSRIHRKDYMNWRKEVLERDEYTCQKTKVKGGKLNVHHIVSWNKDKKLRFNINNGIVLSEKAHMEFHKKYGYRECGRMELEEFLKNDNL